MWTRNYGLRVYGLSSLEVLTPDLAIFGSFQQQFFCPKLPIYKCFDVEILVFSKLAYCGNKFGDFHQNVGYFLSEHLVTLLTILVPGTPRNQMVMCSFLTFTFSN